MFATFYVIMYASSLALISSLLNFDEWLYLFSQFIFKNYVLFVLNDLISSIWIFEALYYIN